jgi:hypothetical protein
MAVSHSPCGHRVMVISFHAYWSQRRDVLIFRTGRHHEYLQVKRSIHCQLYQIEIFYGPVEVFYLTSYASGNSLGRRRMSGVPAAMHGKSQLDMPFGFRIGFRPAPWPVDRSASAIC